MDWRHKAKDSTVKDKTKAKDTKNVIDKATGPSFKDKE